MSDESDADSWGVESPPDEELPDDARIEEFLDRLEGTDTSDEHDVERDPTEAVDLGDGATEPSDPELNGPGSKRSNAGGRLWDSFDSDEETASGGGQPASDPAADETAAPSTTPATDTNLTGGHESGGSTTSESAAPDGDSEPNTTASASASSFKTILKRISNRIDPTSSTASADDNTQPTTEESVGTETTDSGPQPGPPPTAAEQAGTNTAGDGPSGSGYASSQGGQDMIDQILNNIDRFGRATSSSQVLVLSPTAHSITNEIYRRTLLPADGSGQNVLFVSATQTVGDQLEATRRIPDWTEGKTAVIEVGQGGLKPTGPDAGPDVTHKLDVYKRLSKLQHLAKLGVNISHIVSQWNGSHRPTVVGVHTLSAVQQYVGTETMFQFLFTLEGQLNSLGVMGFYHMDPSVHTDNEISTITEAFDLVVRVSSDGTVDIE